MPPMLRYLESLLIYLLNWVPHSSILMHMIYVLLYIVYSTIGFLFLRDYTKKCYMANLEPFEGSVLKFFMMSFLCGGITTIIIIVSFFWAFFEAISKKD